MANTGGGKYELNLVTTQVNLDFESNVNNVLKYQTFFLKLLMKVIFVFNFCIRFMMTERWEDDCGSFNLCSTFYSIWQS